MKKHTLCIALCFYAASSAGQVYITGDTRLAQDIIETGLVHSPLPLDNSRSFEAAGLKNKVLHSEPLVHKKETSHWRHSGLGSIAHSAKEHALSPGGSLKLSIPATTGTRVRGSDSDPDYGAYGSGRATFDVGGKSWEAFNRIAFSIYPDCEGARVVNLNLSFGPVSHLVNLVNREWNHCFLNIGGIARGKIDEVSFGASVKGRDRTTGDTLVYYIDRIELQSVDKPGIESGWVPADGTISYSTTGYMPKGDKTAVANLGGSGGSFSLIDEASGKIAYTSQIKQETTSLGRFDVLDFSDFERQGSYRLRAGGVTSDVFRIDERVWDNSLWRTLSYIFAQRCGHPVPGKHGACHTDLFSEHDGKKIAYSGGWHDAGDLSQQTLQTGDVTYALLEMYNKQKERNKLLAARLLEEAEWGLEFMLKNRYGDGYRASSVGLLIWQDGVIGTYDDISSVRVQNSAFDNFLYSAYEAYASMTIDRDPGLREYLQKVAEEDFDFAIRRHETVGYGEFIHFYEHSYNTSYSQYAATISWAASMLYKLTGKEGYAYLAARYIGDALDCQRTEDVGTGSNSIKGFFYRDTTRRAIVHYVHQSREQVYMQALTLLCETQPGHKDYDKWVKSITLYGDYLKALMQYTAPYGMIPSGVYHEHEYLDSTSFYRLHLFPPDNAVELFGEQVRNGVRLDDKHYLKRFPVWFSIFNGNTAIHLSSGKAAAICGNFLGDDDLLRIGREQMYWTVGKNPFGQSLIYGEGHNYPQLDSFSSGDMTGAMPVGIRSLDNSDLPYWPQVNNACYKEVWVTSAGKWLTLASEY
ncbi:MAG: glycoside hydrolase family 9 protein [Tannerellaceae bacterium]|jgi:hypothetical protein|nr:glycoside hydrolase family 9 protein [Tannerellaceae bacterium]